LDVIDKDRVGDVNQRWRECVLHAGVVVTFFRIRNATRMSEHAKNTKGIVNQGTCHKLSAISQAGRDVMVTANESFPGTI